MRFILSALAGERQGTVRLLPATRSRRQCADAARERLKRKQALSAHRDVSTIVYQRMHLYSSDVSVGTPVVGLEVGVRGQFVENLDHEIEQELHPVGIVPSIVTVLPTVEEVVADDV